MIKNKLALPLDSDIKRVLKADIQELPSFPPVMVKLLEISHDEKASIQDLSKLVETDPGISAKVLGLVNSAFFGLRQKIATVSEAVVYLGFDEVKKISLGVAVFERFIQSGKKKKFDRLFFWRHCLCVATLSLSIAKDIGYPNPDEAYVGGLLHDCSKIFFDLQGRVNYSDFIARMESCPGQIICEERKFMGMGHDDLGAYYSSMWKLPDSIVLAIKYHHQRFDHLSLSRDESMLISIISLADFISWTQGMGSVDIVRPPILQPEIEKIIDVRKIDFVTSINLLDREMEKISKFYNFVFPSNSQLRENLLQANLNLCKINTRHYYNTDASAEPVSVSQIKESLTTPHRSLDPKKIISNTLKAIHKDFGFDRLYVMRVIKKNRCLKVIDSFDSVDTNMDFTQVRIPLNAAAGNFIHSLRKQEPLIISGAAPGERQALEKFNVNEMVIVPFCSQNKVIGVLGMDNIASKTAIFPELLSPIAIVANELGMAMENAGTYKVARADSLRDGLTGLLNRVAIDDLLSRAFNRALAGDNPLAVVMVDVDYFKKFNDNFGHQAGDDILKLIASAMKKLSRPFDHVGRYGGEEFIVILNDTQLSEALIYAERIRKEIQHLGRLLVNRFPGLTLTVSAGVSQYNDKIKTKDALISKADKALYAAKAAGRNRVVKG